jgi:hypothetical protein
MKKLVNLLGRSIIVNGQEILPEGHAQAKVTYAHIATVNNLPVKITAKVTIEDLPKSSDYQYFIVWEKVRRYADKGRTDLVTLEVDENGVEFLNVDMPIVNYE